MSDSFIDPTRCPLCQGQNDCGVAAGRGVCWCFSATVPAEVRERMPEVALDQACDCRGCLDPVQPSA